MIRSNHYETAFEGYLQWHRLCYVAVDETRRSYLGETKVKSLDFIVHGADGSRWLVDVKGRRYPGGKPDRPRRVWESWSRREDVLSLRQWAGRFGPGYQALLVFIYELGDDGDLSDPANLGDRPDEDSWTWRGRRYLLRGVCVDDYQEWMRPRSPRWDTVMLPGAAYRRLVKPFHTFAAHRSLPTAYRPVPSAPTSSKSA